jgi:hypothetical protein
MAKKNHSSDTNPSGAKLSDWNKGTRQPQKYDAGEKRQFTVTLRQIIEELERLEQSLDAALGNAGTTGRTRQKTTPGKGKKMSAATRKKIGLAAKARWAKAKKEGKNKI